MQTPVIYLCWGSRLVAEDNMQMQLEKDREDCRLRVKGGHVRLVVVGEAGTMPLKGRWGSMGSCV